MGTYVDQTYISDYSGANMEKAFDFVFTRVADPFNDEDRTTNFAYEDFCIYDGRLYQCVNPEGAVCPAKGGVFQLTDWDEQKIFDNDGYVIIDGKTSVKNVNKQ